MDLESLRQSFLKRLSDIGQGFISGAQNAVQTNIVTPAQKFVQNNPAPSASLVTNLGGQFNSMEKTYAPKIQSVFDNAGNQFQSGVTGLTDRLVHPVVSPLPDTRMQQFQTALGNIVGQTGNAVIRDVPSMVSGAVKMNPLTQLTQQIAGAEQPSLQPSIQNQRGQDAWRSLELAGLMKAGPVGNAAAGAVNVGLQGIANKMQGNPFLKDYAKNFSEGVTGMAPYGPLGEAVGAGMGLAKNIPIGPLQKGISFLQSVEKPMVQFGSHSVNAEIALRALGAGTKGVAEGIASGAIRPLKDGETRQQAIVGDAIMFAALGGATQAGGDIYAEKLKPIAGKVGIAFKDYWKYLKDNLSGYGWKDAGDGRLVKTKTEPGMIDFSSTASASKIKVKNMEGNVSQTPPTSDLLVAGGKGKKPEVGKGATPMALGENGGVVGHPTGSGKTIYGKEGVSSWKIRKQAESAYLNGDSSQVIQLANRFPNDSVLQTLKEKIVGHPTTLQENPASTQFSRQGIDGNITDQKLLTGLTTPNSIKDAIRIFKKTGKQEPFLKVLGPSDKPIIIPPGGVDKYKLYNEPKAIQNENKAISSWEQSIKNQTVSASSYLQKQALAKSKAFEQSMKQADAALGTTKPYKNGMFIGSFPSKDLSTAQVKDKKPFSYQRETLLRNLEDTFGKSAGKIKAFFHDPIVANETANTKFKNDIKTNLSKTFNDLGIKKGSREDYAAAHYIEGNLTLDQIKKEFPNTWEHIIRAADAGRKVYKDLLTKINTELGKYGYSPIPERQNYVTHTQQIQTLMQKFGNMLNFTKDKLPTEMSAINVTTKPGKEFFKFALKRQGNSTHEGLITALEKYIEPAGNQIFHTGDIQRGRALVKYLMDQAGPQDTRLSNFNSWLSQYVDSLAGKKNIIDRPVEKVIGRGLLNLGNTLRSRLGANMVGGNISSALTNFIPFTQSLATTSKISAVKGLFAGATGVGNPTAIDGVESAFLTRRFPVDSIAKTTGQKISTAANALFSMVDQFTSRSVVAGKFYDGLKTGLKPMEAMKQADEYAARILADRSYGQIPLIFNSKVLGAFTQFQVEVNNQVSYLMKDIPKNMGYNKMQVASALTQFVIYSYLFNNLFEKITGRRPQIDPLHAGISMYQGIQNGQSAKDLLNPANQNSPVGEITSNLPFTSILTGGRIPLSSAMPDFNKLASGDVIGGMQGPIANLGLPFGGAQLRKTLQGTTAFSKGYVPDNKGNIRYLVSQTPANAARMAAFGQYASPESNAYFSNNQKPLSENQSKVVLASNDRTGTYGSILQKRNQDAADTKAVNELKGSGKSVLEKNNKIYILQNNGQVKTIDPSFQPQEPTLTGSGALDAKLISSYKSDITKKEGDVMALYEAKKISAARASEMLIQLAAMKKRYVKASFKRPAKIQLKSSTLKKASQTLARVKLSTPPKIKMPQVSFATPFTPSAAVPQVPNFKAKVKFNV